MVRQIRNFITTKPVDEKGEDLRDMKGILMALSLSDTSSPESSQQSPAGNDRPTLSRQSSSKAPTSNAPSDDPHFDFENMAQIYGDSPEFVSSPNFEWPVAKAACFAPSSVRICKANLAA